ncbi:hypothetical protein GTO10_05890 [Candidatus Saccharibacteria bacterium]|nr:hypothetical protein [Candidatus Saccharibacteria bacterium]
MPKNWKLILLTLLIVAGAVTIVYLFAKEDVQNLGETITGNIAEIPEEGEPTKDTLLLSLLAGAIDFDGQMAKLKQEGFENEYFTAFIGGINTSQKSFTIEMEFPTDSGFEIEQKVASSNCPIDNTVILGADDLEVLAEGEDLFKWVEVGDRIVSYCMDSRCSSIGEECILIKLDAQ